MKRAVEIINSLRQGMDTMLEQKGSVEVRSLRMFNFEKRRVSLRMEVAEAVDEFTPMGRIDVIEFPSKNSSGSCSCTMTDFKSGESQQLILRLTNQAEKEEESFKVFNFFRRVLGLPTTSPDQEKQPIHSAPLPLEQSVQSLREVAPLEPPREKSVNDDHPVEEMPARTRGTQDAGTSD